MLWWSGQLRGKFSGHRVSVWMSQRASRAYVIFSRWDPIFLTLFLKCSLKIEDASTNVSWLMNCQELARVTIGNDSPRRNGVKHMHESRECFKLCHTSLLQCDLICFLRHLQICQEVRIQGREEPWWALISRKEISGRCAHQVSWNSGRFQAYLCETVKFYYYKHCLWSEDDVTWVWRKKHMGGEWELVLGAGGQVRNLHVRKW